MTDMDCTKIGRDQLTWDWNNQYTIPAGDFTLVKPAGAHNNIKVVGTPEKVSIFSNGGAQDRTGHEYLNGDWGSDIQWVELCWTPTTLPEVNPPALNDPVFQWVDGDPTVNCDGMIVTTVSHEESAGWYWGNDNDQHLGGFYPTGNVRETFRPATAEECPDELPEDTDEVVSPINTGVVTEVAQPVTHVPNQLASTGSGLEWAALIMGLAFITAGVVTYLKKPKK